MFYEINKEQADSIGIIEYEPRKYLNPFMAEQKDGTFLVNERMVEIVGDKLKMSFENVVKIQRSEVDFKSDPFEVLSHK